MSDAAGPMNADESSTSRLWVIGVAALLIAAAVVAAILLFGDDDDDGGEATGTTVGSTQPGVDTTDVLPAPGAPPATDSSAATTETAAAELAFTIEDIEDGGTIPVEFTCDGDEESPVVTIESIPEGVLQLAFVVDDPDAPTEDPFVHWLVYDIPGNTHEIVDGSDDFTYGLNDAGTAEWAGPCPPSGDGAHEYVFTLFGLDAELELDPDLDGREVADAIADSVVVETAITASYERA